jgi:multicomponent Na+:H+ antiporter subunit E
MPTHTQPAIIVDQSTYGTYHGLLSWAHAKIKGVANNATAARNSSTVRSTVLSVGLYSIGSEYQNPFRNVTEIADYQRRPMTVKVQRLLLLLLVLACFWLSLSGHFTPMLLALGAASCLFVAWVTSRKGLVDERGALLQIHWGRWCRYQGWLAVQIARAAIDVAARILDPRLPISPVVGHVPADLSDLGKVIYANSITLTPGTVSINLTDDNRIIVHSLTQEGMDELKNGEMLRRVRDVLKQP